MPKYNPDPNLHAKNLGGKLDREEDRKTGTLLTGQELSLPRSEIQNTPRVVVHFHILHGDYLPLYSSHASRTSLKLTPEALFLPDTVGGMLSSRQMAHTAHEKEKLILRIKRIRGQLNSAEKALEEEAGCSEILHTLTASRAAMGSLIAELLEGHIHNHVLNPARKIDKDQITAADELIAVIKTYLR